MNFKRIKSNQWSCFEGILKCKYILEWAVVIYFDLRYIRHWNSFWMHMKIMAIYFECN